MTKLEALEQRHSVRQYTGQPISTETIAALESEINSINAESGLRIQLFTEEPEAFKANQPHYGMFSGCRNYFVIVGPKGKDEEVGYFGQRLVITAQQLGLNTCWVALTYQKGKVKPEIGDGEKLYIVIALGYGVTSGSTRKSKSEAVVSDLSVESPEWYKNGIQAALLAPTAVNQQKFRFSRDGDLVMAKAGLGPYTKIDLGIVKYNFELGAGKENFRWA